MQPGTNSPQDHFPLDQTISQQFVTKRSRQRVRNQNNRLKTQLEEANTAKADLEALLETAKNTNTNLENQLKIKNTHSNRPILITLLAILAIITIAKLVAPTMLLSLPWLIIFSMIIYNQLTSSAQSISPNENTPNPANSKELHKNPQTTHTPTVSETNQALVTKAP